MYLRAIRDTIFKTSTAQSGNLPTDQKIGIERGQTFDIIEHRAEHLHVKVLFVRALQADDPRLEWYAYKPDIEVVGAPEQQYLETTFEPEKQHRAIRLPGYSSPFYLDDPITGCENFTWAEATRNGQRLPLAKVNVLSIIKIAQNLELVRDKIGRPIQITSWYRPPAVNRSVGGASNSRHLVGDAADVQVPGMTPHQLYRLINEFWGDRGGLGRYNWGVHFDTRGYRARW